MRYIIHATVGSIEALGQEPNVAWYVHFIGSHESICLGSDRPPWDAGDTVKITFEKEPNAKSQ